MDGFGDLGDGNIVLFWKGDILDFLNGGVLLVLDRTIVVLCINRCLDWDMIAVSWLNDTGIAKRQRRAFLDGTPGLSLPFKRNGHALNINAGSNIVQRTFDQFRPVFHLVAIDPLVLDQFLSNGGDSLLQDPG